MKYLKESTIMNFMNLVLDMKSMIQEPYEQGWREPKYNFYINRYMLAQDKNKFWVIWENKNDERKAILFVKPKYKNKFLNKVYFMFHSQYQTDDNVRATKVLNQVIFPDFCAELGIKVDFSKATSVKEGAYMVMSALYWNFFSSVSVDRFIDVFHLRNILSKESIEYIKNNDVTQLVNA